MRSKKLKSIEEIFEDCKDFTFRKRSHERESLVAPSLFRESYFTILSSYIEILPKKGILEKEEAKNFITHIWDALSKEDYRFQKSSAVRLGAYGTQIPLYCHSDSTNIKELKGKPYEMYYADEKIFKYFLQRNIGKIESKMEISTDILIKNFPDIEIDNPLNKIELYEELELTIKYE